MHTHTNQLPIWVIYHDPIDVPGKYVARVFLNDSPTKTMYIDDTLEGIRSNIPDGLVRLPAFPGDEPHIVETWI